MSTELRCLPSAFQIAGPCQRLVYNPKYILGDSQLFDPFLRSR